MLDPVMEKQFIIKGKKMSVNVSDKVMDFDPKFMMYFITRLPNPSFSPELQAKVINENYACGDMHEKTPLIPYVVPMNPEPSRFNRIKLIWHRMFTSSPTVSLHQTLPTTKRSPSWTSRLPRRGWKSSCSAALSARNRRRSRSSSVMCWRK